jgi:hypothetical protein
VAEHNSAEMFISNCNSVHYVNCTINAQWIGVLFWYWARVSTASKYLVPARGLLTVTGSYILLLVPSRVSTDCYRQVNITFGTDTYAYDQ